MGRPRPAGPPCPRASCRGPRHPAPVGSRNPTDPAASPGGRYRAQTPRRAHPRRPAPVRRARRIHLPSARSRPRAAGPAAPRRQHRPPPRARAARPAEREERALEVLGLTPDYNQPELPHRVSRIAEYTSTTATARPRSMSGVYADPSRGTRRNGPRPSSNSVTADRASPRREGLPAALRLPAAPSWPQALRATRARLYPSITLQRWWQAWSDRPPPPQLRALINSVAASHGLYLYKPDSTNYRLDVSGEARRESSGRGRHRATGGGSS